MIEKLKTVVDDLTNIERKEKCNTFLREVCMHSLCVRITLADPHPDATLHLFS